MKVTIEEMPEIPVYNRGLKYTGLVIRIRDTNGKSEGGMVIGHAKVRWAKGRNWRKTGKDIPLADLIAFFDSYGTKS